MEQCRKFNVRLVLSNSIGELDSDAAGQEDSVLLGESDTFRGAMRMAREVGSDRLRSDPLADRLEITDGDDKVVWRSV